MTDMPTVGGRLKTWPADGTIAHVRLIGTIKLKSGNCAPLPGGFFVRTCLPATPTVGYYRILTLPQSAMPLIALGQGRWDWAAIFEGNLAPRARNMSWYIELEIVPPDLAEAIEAVLKLDGFNEATDQPMVVDDGWLT